MPAAKKAGKAAVAERDGSTSHTLTWRDVEFVLPVKLPASMAWAIADVESSDGTSVAPVLALLRSLLGADQEKQLRAKLEADQVTLDELPDALSELLASVFDTYGMAEGDSDASAPS